MAAINTRSPFSSFSISSTACLPSPTSPPRESAAAFVPFLWEEKPGVSKHFAAGSAVDCKLSPEKSQPLHFFIGGLDVQPLPAPPRLQKTWNAEPSRSPRKGESLSKRWQGWKAREEDDPFVRAMEACARNNSSQGSQKPSRTLLQRMFENEDEDSGHTKFPSSPGIKSQTSPRKFPSGPSPGTKSQTSPRKFLPSPLTNSKASLPQPRSNLSSLRDTSPQPPTPLPLKPQHSPQAPHTHLQPPKHPPSHVPSPLLSTHLPPRTLRQDFAQAFEYTPITYPSVDLPHKDSPIATPRRSHAPKVANHHRRMSLGHDKIVFMGCLGCRNVENDDCIATPQWAL